MVLVLNLDSQTCHLHRQIFYPRLCSRVHQAVNCNCPGVLWFGFYEMVPHCASHIVQKSSHIFNILFSSELGLKTHIRHRSCSPETSKYKRINAIARVLDTCQLKIGKVSCQQYFKSLSFKSRNIFFASPDVAANRPTNGWVSRSQMFTSQCLLLCQKYLK